MGRSLAAPLLLATLAACPARSPRGFDTPPADGTVVADAVDGVSCTKTPLTDSAIFEGRTYYFCTAETAGRFRKHPEKHADPGRPAA